MSFLQLEFQEMRSLLAGLRKLFNTEIFAYIFWGVLSFAFNIVCFYFLLALGVEYKIANIVTLILLKLFVFFTNKYFVFRTPSANFFGVIIEFVKFLFARLVTNLIDFFGLIFWAEILQWDVFYGKLLISAIVIAVNFLISKFFVFKN